MYKRLGVFTILTCFFLYSCGGPIKSMVRVPEDEYANLKGIPKIFVETKDGKQYEVYQFKFSESHLTGRKQIQRGMMIPVELEIADIVEVKKEVKGAFDNEGKIITKDEIKMKASSWNRLGMGMLGILVGISLGRIAGGLLYFSTNSGGVGLVAWGGAIISGGLIGIQIGKNKDERKAIEKIKKERAQDKNETEE